MLTRPKIAFVDDEPKILSGLQRSLRGRRDDWDMEFFANPVEALACFIDNPPNVAVIDIRMPQMNGLDLAREIADCCQGTVCIVLSGSTDFDIAIASINDGNVFRYYVKPCAAGVLVEGIEAGLARRNRRKEDDPQTPIPKPPEAVSQFSNLALDMIQYGVLVADEKGQVLFTNARAGRMLSSPKGLTLDAQGVCRAARPEETERLHHAMAQARDDGGTTALTLEGDHGTPLRVTVQPYEAHGPDDANLICLFLFAEDEISAPKPKLLMSMFGLTVSESRLAAAMAKGLSLEEAAEECGITKATARTYLKTIFSKLGVTRQAELVRTILISLAGGQ